MQRGTGQRIITYNFGLTSPVWKWGVLLVVCLFIACSIYLLVSVRVQQREVVTNINSISNLNKLRKGIRSLSRSLIESDTSQHVSWPVLYNNYQRHRAGVDMDHARTLGYHTLIEHSDLYVLEMSNAYKEYSGIKGIKVDKIAVEDRFILYMNEALDELERAIEKIRVEQTMHTQELTARLNALGILVIIACLLAIFITGLFWKYQLDIAARRKAEEALEVASEQVFDLYNNAPCGYHSLNSNGVFVNVNDTELSWLGYTREEIIGKMLFTDVLTPESIDIFRKRFPEFKEKGTTPELEFVMVRKDGTTFPVSVRATAIYDKDGKYLKSRSTVLDITERKLVEEENKSKNIAILNAYKKLEMTARELEAVNKELESFSYSISHDLRAPLRAINSYSQILEEEYGGQLDDEGKRLLGIVKGSAKKMGILIDDLLALARLGKKEVKKSAVDMNELVHSTIRDIERNHSNLRVTFTVEDLPPAWGDYGLLTQVVYNLLSNAVKYSSKKDNPEVIIGAKAYAEEHIYHVKDNGAGFDMAYAEKIFGVFQRLHHVSEFEGTGVGLAIVHRIISRHGGRVWAEAEKEKGAVFYFSLPVK
jgi:PAS domain S-box-containing protein